MATITTTQSFTTGDQVTAGTLNAIATSSAFDTSVVDDSSTALTTNASGTANSRIIVKDGGITPAKLSTGGPNWSTSLGYGNLTINSLNGNDSVTIFSTDDNKSGFNLGGDAGSEGLGQILYDRSSGALIFGNGTFASATEAMRINSDGAVLIGKSSGTNDTTTAGHIFQKGGKTVSTIDGTEQNFVAAHFNATGTIKAMEMYYNGSVVGSITKTSSATAFNTSSDYRLKEDIVEMQDSIERVKELKPVNFAWKVDGTRVDGFIAHELQEVIPGAVTGTKDAVDDEGNPEYQGISQAKLVPLLTKALQEALVKIENLEAKFAALNS